MCCGGYWVLLFGSCSVDVVTWHVVENVLVSIDAPHGGMFVKGESGRALSTLVNSSSVVSTSVSVCLSVSV